MFRKRVIYTVHDGLLHKGEKNLASQFLQDQRIGNATDLIFLTEFIKNQVTNKLLKGKLIHIIPHGLFELDYQSVVTDSTENLNLLFFGRISEYKGVELLYNAFQKNNNKAMQLRICGKSDYELKLHNTANIIIENNYLDELEIKEQLQWADVLIIPYEEATQSGVIALGISAELPMICTKLGGLVEQLQQDEALWVNYDLNELIDAINKMKDVELRLKLSNKMKDKKKTLSWDTIAASSEVAILSLN